MVQAILFAATLQGAVVISKYLKIIICNFQCCWHSTQEGIWPPSKTLVTEVKAWEWRFNIPHYTSQYPINFLMDGTLAEHYANLVVSKKNPTHVNPYQ